MDSANTPGMAGDDLSALAWVHGELRRSLEAANRALRRYLKEAEAGIGSDVDAVDPSVLRAARAQLHQGVGALELVGLPAVADVLRASEAAVQRMANKPALVTAAAVDTVERASFALLDFLGRQLAGKPVSPVMLFPQYRATQQLAGADRVHPADLWKIEWQWRELPVDMSATPRPADEDARSMMEMLVLGVMRQGQGGAGSSVFASLGGDASTLFAQLSDLCAGLAAHARQSSFSLPHLATFWQLAAAVFEAESQGLLASDNYTKRIASRLLAQVRPRAGGGPAELSDRLAQDLLFFCNHAKPPAPYQAPRLEAVRKVWQLDTLPSADYETPRLGRFDPALLLLARKRVAAAKDSWSAVAGGELHRLQNLNEQFTLVGESLQRLLPGGEGLAHALQAAVTQTVNAEAAPPAALAMEVATGILYLDASLEDGEFDHPELADRVERLARRIDDVRVGAEPQPLDVWMEELYRRVSDRQTMGSVVQELRASLSEIEKQIDAYFRDPSQRQMLIPVPAQLSSMRGVLSVLGLEQASQAALHMRDDVDALAQTEVDPQRAVQTGTFDRLADNLGALSFLIDMLSVQPALAKSLFRFDPETGSLSAVMGQTERVSAFAAFDDTASVTVRQDTIRQELTVPLPLTDRLSELADLAAGTGVSDGELAMRLESLSRHAYAADQPELARLLATAQSTLRNGADAAVRAAVRNDLVQAAAALAPPPAPPVPPSAPVPPERQAPVAAGSSGLEDDAEMREIFIEEAREVITDARAALERLADAPENANELTAVRRAFHTLKGSSRMVGLTEFGDGGWACEQLYNSRLAQAPRMDSALRLFTTEALDYLAGWTEAIAEGRARGHNAADLARSADALRLDGTRVPLVMPDGATPTPTQMLPPRPVDEAPPTQLLLPAAPPPEPVPAPMMPEFSLDLGEPEAELDAPFDGAALAARVPDLPSASDLGLAAFGDAESAPLAHLAPAPMPAGVESLLDLPLDAPPPEAEPAAMPQGEALEISLDDLDAAFLPQPEPVAEPAVAPASAPDIDGALAASEAEISFDLPQPARDMLADVAPDIVPDVFPEPVADLALELPAAADEAAVPSEEEEQVKVIGPLRISIPLFNIYLNEADELSRRLVTTLAEWAHESERHPVPDSSVALAHSLAGNSATVGYSDLSALARALEHALLRSHEFGYGREGEPALFNDAAEEVRRLLHQFAAGFLREVQPELMERLAAHERLPFEEPAAEPGRPTDALLDVVPSSAAVPADDIGLVDHIDTELLPIFEEEADELLPQLQSRLRDWLDRPSDPDAPMACMRTLHTVKGGARLAGAMRMGEMAHRLESAIEALAQRGGATVEEIEPLLMRADAMSAAFDTLRKAVAPAPAPRPSGPPVLVLVPPPPAPPAPAPVLETLDLLHLEFEPEPEAEPADVPGEPVALLQLPQGEYASSAAAPLDDGAEVSPEPAAEPVPEAVPETLPELETATEPEPEPEPIHEQEPKAEPNAEPVAAAPVEPPPLPQIDWARFSTGAALPAAVVAERTASSGGAVVRVRSGLLDRMVNQAGEVSITRARIDSDVKQLQGSLGELTDSLERMRRQLRDIELQAETQISTRIEAAKAAAQAFDPLEMDRFTRFQELTRFMAESVNDVATLQRSLQRTLQSTEDELAAQARLTRELQDDLLRTRMVEFESVSERLHRTARQAARETGKQARLDIVGGAIEVDRGVLERMAGSFEHLLRNSVAHGIETPQARAAAGKDASGVISVTVAQAGNEVAVEFADDGGGLDLRRIRERAVERGLVAADAAVGDEELRQLIFRPGFSTAETVTELAGRGVGLDVVRAEVNAMGGRIETQSEPGRGTRFKLLLPLTTAVTQVVMLRCGEQTVAVPSTLIEVVRRVPTTEAAAAYEADALDFGGEHVPFFWLSALLRTGQRGELTGRTQTVVVIRSAAQRVALHVDEVVGNQEVVVKNVGPQLSRLPGLAGVTLLPSGAVALIYNPVALSALYGDEARGRMHGATRATATAPVEPMPSEPKARTPMVMVVDDSLTVRRVTQRLLVREGYRVVTAKDGLDALEKLAQERPVVLLSDIEMPRMDGFDLVRNVRADPAMAKLPVVMITSRIAQKHRDYATELGVDHYLGKPYSEEELLALVARYAGVSIPA